MNKIYVALLAAVLLSGCANVEMRPGDGFQLASRQHLYNQKNWFFEGRLAVADKKDSLSANVSWRHSANSEEIMLSGPLSQGKVMISVQAGKVIVDDGDSKQEYTGDVETVFSQQLGMAMPVAALKFWVLGLVDPAQAWTGQADGFSQSGWQITYKEMQQTNNQWLPRKLNVENAQTKIKLIVDQWDLS